MKSPMFVWAFAVLLPAALAHAEKPPTTPGLVVTEFARHADQGGKEELYVEPKDFGEAISRRYRIENLQGWKHGTDRNAIAAGFLEIEKDGVHEFRTDSYYDRNQLRIDGEIVCHYQDGTDRVKKAKLQKGLVPIESIGFVASRGETVGIKVEWRPPGQREFGPIPTELFSHEVREGLRESPYEEKPKDTRSTIATPLLSALPNLVARELTIVAKDFVTEIYHNGRRLEAGERHMVLDRFGATAEKVTVDVKAGDWLVFHVAVNRLRHGGSRYFAVTGHLDGERVGFVSDDSESWSSCDHPELVPDFIRSREAGTESRVVNLGKKLEWHEGRKFMEKYSGTKWTGDAIWGTAASTWIKYRVPEQKTIEIVGENSFPYPVGKITLGSEPTGSPPSRPKVTKSDESTSATEPDEAKKPEQAPLAITRPTRWPVQIISAIYGTGGKNADVTERVRELVEVEQAFFAANPKHLGADPNPYWNKGLHIVYLKDGVRREQRRNENEHILPESFYGPQDAAELERWIEGTRWRGPRGEIQFHPNRRLAGPGLGGEGDWEPKGPNRLQIRWPKEEGLTEYRFDYVWSSFRVPDDGKNEYRIVK